MPEPTPTLLLAALLTLLPLLAFAFEPRTVAERARNLSLPVRVFAPALVAVPYLLVTFQTGLFRWYWLLFYLFVPVSIAILLRYASRIDRQQNGVWPDFVVLAFLGLAVDLRWLEAAWPPHLAVFNKILLLDVGIWTFTAIRHLHRVGFDLRLRLDDLRRGGLNFAFYAPIGILLGLATRFLHFHFQLPDLTLAAGSALFTFFFIAVPEELFFRGWLQNLLERRLGANRALALTSILFGLSHFNKRAAHFNWPYVLLATIAGVFYGLAWRGTGRHPEHRVAAAAVTHTLVDTLWSLFFV